MHDHVRSRDEAAVPSARHVRVSDPHAVMVRTPSPRRHVPSPAVRGRVEVRVRHALDDRRVRSGRHPHPTVPGRVDPLPRGIRVHPLRRRGRRLSRSGRRGRGWIARGRRLVLRRRRRHRRKRLRLRISCGRWRGRRCCRGVPGRRRRSLGIGGRRGRRRWRRRHGFGRCRGRLLRRGRAAPHQRDQRPRTHSGDHVLHGSAR
jgi:hypothetical protein